jgi:riboflavin kinase/FMN adenylyltransferase
MGDCINSVSLEALGHHGLKRIAVAIGVFDGVHLGHQLLLKRLLAMSERNSAVPVVLTFFPHPRHILFPEEPLAMLFSPEKKFKLLAAQNVQAVVTLPFSKDFSNLTADQFLEDCLFSPTIEISGICVGSKWRFGRGGKGDADTIHHYADLHNFEFDPVEEFYLEGRTVSSTAIRRAVSGGDLDSASAMLGRYYSLSGSVVHGAFDGTSVLECPTANISVSDGIIPPDGVYAGCAEVEGRKYSAAVSVGTSPTFADKVRLSSDIEVHLLDFNGNLYGKELEVEFVQYLREERCYSSSEELKKQIEIDLEKIRGIVSII